MNRLSKRILYSLLFFLSPFQLFGQGFPAIKNIYPEEYGGHRFTFDVVQDSNGTVLIGSGSGIIFYDGISWRNKHIPNADPVYSLLVSKDNIVYYGGNRGEFGYFDSDSLNRVLPTSLRDKLKIQGPTGNIWSIHELEDGIYFQIYEGGFLYWDGTKVDYYDFGMPISTSFKVNESIVFFSKTHGLFVFDGDSLLVISKDELLMDEVSFVFTVLPYKKDLIIGIRDKGLMVYSGGELIPFDKELNRFLIQSDKLQGAEYIGNGRIVLYTSDLGIIIVNEDKSFSQINQRNELDEELSLSTNLIHKVKPDKESILWLLHDNGLSRINTFNPQFVFGSKGFNSEEIEFDSSVPESKIRNKFRERWGVELEVLGLIDSVLYAGTQEGLFVVSKDSLSIEKTQVFYDYDIMNKQVFRFHQDKQGDIWFRTNRRIKFFKKISPGLYEKIDHRIGTIGDGREIFSITSKDSSVWFKEYDRIYKLEKNLLTDYKTDFKTNITGIYVNNDSLIYGGFGEPVNPIVLPYEDNELRFTYAAASYIDETRNTYSIMLEGFDETWSDWSLETQKDYTNIPEGDYIFRVRSKNVYEVDGREDAILFSVLPPWYRTWWAYMLYMIGFSGLVYTGHRIRVNQLLKVERMRTKIASDLHDDVSATLTGISYFAKAANKQKEEEKREHFLNLISESAGDAKEKISDIVWAISPENDNWEGFLSRCRRYASDLLESSGLDYDLKITEFIPGKLKMQVRQHVWMIFKEMLTNVVQHAQATRVDIILDVEDDTLKLIIQDNGKGIDHSGYSYGNGLANIRTRADTIKARIELNSEENTGTRWRLELDL